ncbi:MAG: hypothetical protein Q8L66_13315 [Caulobacter sp.]|nr:hypothetical protein [Caulobacter sp.]
MARMLVRGLVGLMGLLGLLLALRFWTSPAVIGGAMDLTAGGAAGLGTLRADMAGFFGGVGLLSLAAALRDDGRWLTPVLLLVGLALSGRVINLVLTGGGAVLYPPMIIEAVLIAISGLGWRVLSERAK